VGFISLLSLCHISYNDIFACSKQNIFDEMYLHALNKARSSLTETSICSSVWLIHLHEVAEKDLRFVRDMPKEIAVARVQAWFVAIKHHVLTYLSCVSKPGNEIWCVTTQLKKVLLQITYCQVFNSQNCCNATFF
jgi:hypothetical protein